ncbi:MAG: iron-containing alcohol dehydrogenase, partial [Propionicimonas sp.]
MLTFTFATAGRISFGAGAAAHLVPTVAELGARPFICTGSNPDRFAGLLDGLPGASRFAVSGEPSFDVVRAGAAAARKLGADVVVGLGGGAVLDAAKAIAAVVTNGGDPLDYD